MLRWDDERLATLIFHELAHQKFYLRDDTAFNESFATFVEQEGTRQWREYRGLPPADGREEKRREQFTALVLASRAKHFMPGRWTMPPSVPARLPNSSACAASTRR
jgi:predicted aminopeptidase